MKPLGDGFIKLIKMIIGPIIFCTVVSGIAGVRDMKKVGRVGRQGAAVLRGDLHLRAADRPAVRAHTRSQASDSTSIRPRSTPRRSRNT
ncbi:cation:dicarboxylate symporter family transporter [Cupriavidus basilensis]